MTTVTYRIYMTGDPGSFHVDALAASVEGVWHNTALVGDETVAFITLPADHVEYLEELLEADENTISYGEYSRQEQERAASPFTR